MDGMILGTVLTREPDWTALPATTPASIKRLLGRCLEKDPNPCLPARLIHYFGTNQLQHALVPRALR